MENTATKTLAAMAAEVDQYCRDKGWREHETTFGEACALLHEEIGEAGAAWRKHGLEPWYVHKSYPPEPDAVPKPEGVGSEFADIFIRLLDDSVIFGADLDHGVGRVVVPCAPGASFLEHMNDLHTLVSRASDVGLGRGDMLLGMEEHFAGILVFLRQLCDLYGIDLLAEYEKKMTYNRSRPYRHGGKRR